MSRFKSLFTGAESTTRPRKNSASSVESVPSRKNSLSSPPPQRFVVHADSTHEHHLKSARRQEKLTGMLRELLGTKKRDEAVSAVPGLLKENNDVVGVGGGGGGGPPTSGSSSETPSTPPSQPQPPSLLSGLVSQIRKGDTDAATESVLRQVDSNSESFVRKYGKCQEVIGRGSFGIVRVAHKTDGQLYAVKEFKKRPQESDKEYNRRLTSEFCISSSLHHPNIIHTLDLLHDAKGEYCEVMEFCSGGDLYSLILAAGKLEFLEADCFFKQILLGVNYMHQMGVAHRDLKPENILLTANGAVKITDFGNGECFRMAWEKEIHLSRGLCGSTPYIAPEEYGDEVFDPRPVDIWALGVIYMAMRTGRHLWTIARVCDDEFYDRYLKGRKSEKGYEPIESLKRARCRNVIYSILDPVPSRRITGKQILKSEWGREIYICQAGTSGT